MRAVRSLCDHGLDVLRSPCARTKASLTRKAIQSYRSGAIPLGKQPSTLESPVMPPKLELVEPRFVPGINNGTLCTPATWILLSIAHIEHIAVCSYWDTLLRSIGPMPEDYTNQLIGIIDDESRHFLMVEDRLNGLGTQYGAIPAHNGLWSLVHDTKHDLLARLAIVPLVQEARGLDAGPKFVHRLESERDKASAAIVAQIVNEEEGHVSFGLAWFQFLCRQRNLESVPTFHTLVRQYMPKGLFPPFNVEARLRAGFSKDYYGPLEARR